MSDSFHLCMQCGWFLTVANLGDSRALVDTGAAVSQLTVDHRVATHVGERARLELEKVLIAPIDTYGEWAPCLQRCGSHSSLWPIASFLHFVVTGCIFSFCHTSSCSSVLTP